MGFDDKEFIAKKIKLARKAAKLTQDELSEKIGISAKQLSRIEMATYIPSLPTFFKIVHALKIDVRDFGLDKYETTSPLQQEILKIIYSLNDSELEYYHSVLKTMIENVELLRNK